MNSSDAVRWAWRILRQFHARRAGKMIRPRVYLSGPITGGDRNWNQFQANVYHKLLMRAGFAVLNPMPTGVLPFAWESPEQGGIDHAGWLESDFAWIAVSDMILRLPGESKGGDMETAFAERLGIPVHTPATFPWPDGFNVAEHLAPVQLMAA